MPPDRLEFRISYFKLLIILLLTLVPISIAGLFGVSRSTQSIRQLIGNHFSTIAASAAAEASQFIHERTIDVALLAADPVVLDAVAASNRSYQEMSDEAIGAKFARIDRIWNTPEAEPVINEILSSRASRALRRHLELNPRFLRITVTDAKGATVAATHKTADYFQADEDYWQNIYAGGKGAMSLTDILHDDVSKAEYIGIGVPVVEEGSNRFIGTVDALVDVSSLSPIVTRPSIGPTARVQLVKEDGTIICAPHVAYAMKVNSDEYAAVRDAMGKLPLTAGTFGGEQPGYLVANLAAGSRRLIGFADTGLKQDYRNLGWTALVSQEARYAFAPVRFVGRLILLMSALGLAMVTLLGVYFALHRRPPFTEIGEVTGREPAIPPKREGEGS